MHLMSQNREPSREECFSAQRELQELSQAPGWQSIRDFLETTCLMIDEQLRTCTPEALPVLQARWAAYDLMIRLPEDDGLLINFYNRVLQQQADEKEDDA